MAVLPAVLGCRILRRTVKVRLGTNPLRLAGGTPIFTVSQRRLVKYAGLPEATLIRSAQCCPAEESMVQSGEGG